jgi:transcriptional regulator with XRE-family HTH domain
MPVEAARQTRDFSELFRLERHAFAAKIRMSRAVLGWSQSELGARIGMTQRAIHKLEQGETEPRRTTMRALEEIWRDHQIEFEDNADGGFRVTIRSAILDEQSAGQKRRSRGPRQDLGVTSTTRKSA